MLGSIISGIGSIVGGIFGRNNAKDQMEAQERFAQNAIQWKVADAKAAGIHPLYALGAPTVSYSPVSDGGLSNAISNAGQFLGRAVDSNSSGPERIAARTLATLSIEKAGLENDLLRSQIARLNQAQNPPAPSTGNPWLIPGQSSSGVSSSAIQEGPMKRVITTLSPHSEPGAVPDVGYSSSSLGHHPVPSSDVKERIEDNIIQELMWAYRNNILPSIGFNYQPPYPAPEGSKWVYNPFTQSYQLKSFSMEGVRERVRALSSGRR